MKSLNLFALSCILALGYATSSIAAGGHRVDSVVAARDRVASAARDTKGVPRANLDIERIRLNRLIADLEAGRAVDPMKIDDELRRAERLTR